MPGIWRKASAPGSRFAVSPGSAFGGRDRSTVPDEILVTERWSPKTRSGAGALVEFVGRGQGRSTAGERDRVEVHAPPRFSPWPARPGERRLPFGLRSASVGFRRLPFGLRWPPPRSPLARAACSERGPREHPFRGNGRARKCLILQGKSRFFLSAAIHFVEPQSAALVETGADRRSLVSLVLTLVKPADSWGFSGRFGAVL